MKAQPLTEKLLDELTGFDQSVTLNEFTQRRYLLECDKAIRVEPAEGYMCKGIVYALSNNFDKMCESFQRARMLSPSDYLIKSNYIASLGNYGRFEELIGLVKPEEAIENSNLLHALFRALIATAEIELLTQINPKYAQRIKQAIANQYLELETVKQYIFLFNNLMRQKKLRFAMIPSISWLEDDGDLFVYYDFVGSASESMELMDEFDNLVAERGLKQVARKLTIVLIPLRPC
ncbi:hypothetical protein [Acinetobacter sp. Ver3]|uniref:hypothetical protein n=1 Tax=Acinetobacter sp. Ver3 TaxID=466088 RepID=UPI00044588F4|nr:hypothetical protein [Acinetobacter sp. Ver3]EZQ10782.1 hypothetical protein CL42_06270 [Acinetobacter sp. Ver3]